MNLFQIQEDKLMSITDNSVASVKITAIDSTIENNLKLSIDNGASDIN